MTKVKEIDPEQERRIEASRSMSSASGGGFAKGMRMFTKGAWSGNDDEAQRGLGSAWARAVLVVWSGRSRRGSLG